MNEMKLAAAHRLKSSRVVQVLVAFAFAAAACDRIVPADQTPVVNMVSDTVNPAGQNFVLAARRVLDPVQGFAGVEAPDGVAIDFLDDALEITSSGSDPQVLLPAIGMRPGARFAVRIDQTSAVPATLELFYTTLQAPGFSQAQALAISVEAGRSSVLFAINDPGFTGRLRFDPGRAPGAYRIHAIEFFSSEPINLPTEQR